MIGASQRENEEQHEIAAASGTLRGRFGSALVGAHSKDEDKCIENSTPPLRTASMSLLLTQSAPRGDWGVLKWLAERSGEQQGSPSLPLKMYA